MRTIRIFWDEDAMMFYVEFVQRDRLANLCLPVNWNLLPYWCRSWIANGDLPVISNGPKIAQAEQSKAETPTATPTGSKESPEESLVYDKWLGWHISTHIPTKKGKKGKP